MIYIKDMDMPVDCLACRISCKHESYLVTGRPKDCPLEEAPDGDLISRADAIEAVRKELVCDGRHEAHDKTCRFIADVLLSALPSADAVSREDYHNLLTASNDIDRALREYQAKEEQLSAEAVIREGYNETDGVIQIEKQSAKDVGEIKHIVIHSPNYTRYFYNESMPTSAEAVHKPDYSYEADMVRRLKETLSAEAVQGDGRNNIKRYPNCQMRTSLGNCDAIGGFCTSINAPICDAFHKLSEAVQGWIPCSERLPNELEAVNVTWINHNPPVYYQYTKDVPNADTAVYYRGVWYWWDSTICDVLGEYGEKCGAEQIDKDIEILAWMPLPNPYKGGDDKWPK